MTGNASIVLEHSTDMDETSNETVVASYARWAGANPTYHRPSRLSRGYSSSGCGGDCMSCRS